MEMDTKPNKYSGPRPRCRAAHRRAPCSPNPFPGTRDVVRFGARTLDEPE